MLTSSRRPLAGLALAALCAGALAQTPVTDSPATPPASARSLDLSAAETKPLADGLGQDLGPLLAAAQYGRSGDNPSAPKNRLTSVARLTGALGRHQGVAFVALAERTGSGNEVELRALYVLEGAPIGDGAPAPGPTSAPGKGAVYLDLTGETAKPLLASLQGHLGALLPAAGAGSPTTADEVIKALSGNRGVAYVVLAERTGETTVDRSRVFVAPDVLHISITDDAHATSSADAPEVELVPDPAGGPPLIKFEFDPKKYEVREKK